MEPTYCIRPALEAWNFHTTERDAEKVPVAGISWIASGQANSMTTFRGHSSSDNVLRFNTKGRLIIGGVEIYRPLIVNAVAVLLTRWATTTQRRCT